MKHGCICFYIALYYFLMKIIHFYADFFLCNIIMFMFIWSTQQKIFIFNKFEKIIRTAIGHIKFFYIFDIIQ